MSETDSGSARGILKRGKFEVGAACNILFCVHTGSCVSSHLHSLSTFLWHFLLGKWFYVLQDNLRWVIRLILQNPHCLFSNVMATKCEQRNCVIK